MPMPSFTLKRSRRRQITLTPSFTTAITSTLFPSRRGNKSRKPSLTEIDTNRTPDSLANPGRDGVYFCPSPPPADHRTAKSGFKYFSPTSKTNTHHALPSELLAHIFVLGAEDDTAFPVLVSHVCSTWRAVALHTPRLWRCIVLDGREGMWKERIRRAKHCTLDVKLSSPCTTRSRFPPRHAHLPQSPHVLDSRDVQWYMHFVTPYMQRWRSLSINFDAYAPFLWNAALSACCGDRRYGFVDVSAPMLEEMELVFRNNDDTKEFTLFGGVAPRLRRLTLSGVQLAWLPCMFGNLTFLDYTHHGASSGREAAGRILSMLHVSCTLEELRLSFPGGLVGRGVSSRFAWERAPVALSRLRTLCIRILDYDIRPELIYVVSHISGPGLVSVHFEHMRRYLLSPRSVSALFSVFRGHAGLRVVHAEGGWCDGGMLVGLVRTLPGVRRVCVSGWQVREELVRERNEQGGVIEVVWAGN